MRIGIGLTATLVALALAACGSDRSGEPGAADTQTAPAATETGAAPAGAQELATGELGAGRHVAAAFALPFSFEAREGWRVVEYGLDAVTLAREAGGRDEGTIRFRAIERVYDPTTDAPVPAPRNLVAWLQRHPDLEVRSAHGGELGGAPVTRVRLQAAPTGRGAPGCEGPCVRIAPPAAGGGDDALVLDRSATELLVLPLEGAGSAIAHVSARSQAFRAEAAGLLGTLRFEPAS